MSRVSAMELTGNSLMVEEIAKLRKMKNKPKMIGIVIALMLIFSMSAAGFQMNSTNYVISGITDSFGGVSNSTNYSVTSAVGEPVVGYSSSTNFNLYSGIFYSFLMPEEENVTCDPCDLNCDGIVYHDWNDLMTGYKCFLGIGNCNKITYQNWTAVKDEYDCFVGS